MCDSRRVCHTKYWSFFLLLYIPVVLLQFLKLQCFCCVFIWWSNDENVFIFTHNHVLQGTLGQPAVKKHGNENVPDGRPKNLRREENTSTYVQRYCIQTSSISFYVDNHIVTSRCCCIFLFEETSEIDVFMLNREGWTEHSSFWACNLSSMKMSACFCAQSQMTHTHTHTGLKLYKCNSNYCNDEGNCIDHLQKKRHLENLFPNVPLKMRKTFVTSSRQWVSAQWSHILVLCGFCLTIT